MVEEGARVDVYARDVSYHETVSLVQRVVEAGLRRVGKEELRRKGGRGNRKREMRRINRGNEDVERRELARGAVVS